MSNVTGINSTIATLNRAVNPKRAMAICKRLAEMGADTARMNFDGAIYDGNPDVAVTVEKIEDGSAIVARGEDVLFIEFGAGIRYAGYPHPQAMEFGFGPGTWSDGPNGRGHWDDPKGWFLPQEKGGYRTFGNPPALAMAEAGQTVRNNLEAVIKEEYGDA